MYMHFSFTLTPERDFGLSNISIMYIVRPIVNLCSYVLLRELNSSITYAS